MGTSYVSFEHIPVNVLSTFSHLVRLLQLADLVTSCTTAYVAGEDTYAPPVFPAILAIAHRDYDCIGDVTLRSAPTTVTAISTTGCWATPISSATRVACRSPGRPTPTPTTHVFPSHGRDLRAA
jgi:hypothetical protein